MTALRFLAYWFALSCVVGLLLGLVITVGSYLEDRNRW